MAAHHFYVTLIPHDSADRRCNIRGRQGCGCDLVKQWLKQVEIALVNQDDFGRRMPQRAGAGQSAESRAQDNDARQ
jgi:hypothetical protein